MPSPAGSACDCVPDPVVTLPDDFCVSAFPVSLDDSALPADDEDSEDFNKEFIMKVPGVFVRDSEGVFVRDSEGLIFVFDDVFVCALTFVFGLPSVLSSFSVLGRWFSFPSLDAVLFRSFDSFS